MRIVIPDDYQDIVRRLDCWQVLQGQEVTVHHDTVKGVEALSERFAQAEAIVLTRERTVITSALLDRLPRLRIISQTGAVAAHLDVAACTERGIAVAAGEGAGTATAELAWGLILASARRLVDEANRLKGGQWQGHVGYKLQGRRLGVWSYGRIGKRVAEYGRAFGMQVWVWGGPDSTARARSDGFEVAPSRDAFFEQTDVLSLQIRLSPTSRGIVRREDLARMKPSALIVNTSRAELIEPGALVDALKAGRPGFAAVDTFEDEPILGASHPLLALPNALCTPHLGFVEQDNYENYYGTAFRNIVAFAAGTPQGLVNPEALSRGR
jgi:D-3-phosphoglycerate dehydrogenase